MLKELVELAGNLEEEVLPPVGFSSYSNNPIKWMVTIIPGLPVDIHIGESGVSPPRPMIAKRTSGIFSYPVADEAGYALGVSKKEKKGGFDEDAGKKHDAFMRLLQEVLDSPLVKDRDLRQALESLDAVIKNRLVEKDPKYQEIANKDWVSFAYEGGGLGGKHLFQHPDIKAFWQDRVASEVAKHKKSGEIEQGFCSVCGKHGPLIRIIPTKVKLFKGRRQLMSINENAFVSFNTDDADAHLGVCLTCGENAAQALNLLLSKESYHQELMTDLKAKGKTDFNTFKNHMAVFWLKHGPKGAPEAEEEQEPLKLFSAPLDPNPKAEATLNLLQEALKIPWHSQESVLSIPDNRFYLAVLSPNGKGRIAIREWISVSLRPLVKNLNAFVEALKIVGPVGEEPRAFSIPRIIEIFKNARRAKKRREGEKGGIQNIVDVSPNLLRGLLRTAYLSQPPPPGLLEDAVQRLRTPQGRELAAYQENAPPFQIIAAAIKLALTFKKEEAKTMQQLDPYREQPAYLSGRLFAVLEEIQRLHARPKKLNTTIVDRFYGAASLTPKAALGGLLLSRAKTSHLPKLRRDNQGYRMEKLLTEVMNQIDAAGGFPHTLTMPGQAEFALGYYHQRAALAFKKDKPEEPALENSNNPEEVQT
ncbi:MAG: type I-C CRISPR-associated protein Cas8c/Csd1 [Desulfobaccales bacterium]|jgi:CRISPR-associated protein Csd1